MRHLWMMIVAAAFIAAPATAQEISGDFTPEAGDWEFLLAGSGTSDNDVETGNFSVDAELGYYLTDVVAVAARQRVSYDDDNAGTDWNGQTRVAIDYHFDLGQWRPFIGANIGYVYGDGVRDTWAAGPEAGVKWYVKDETFIFARAEYQFFFRNGDDISDNFDDGNFIYTVGIGFNF